jgi:hypothetical protein
LLSVAARLTWATKTMLDTIVDDKLDGVPAIAEFIGESERRTRYLIQLGIIPAGKWAGRYIGSKRNICATYRRATSGTAQPELADPKAA